MKFSVIKTQDNRFAPAYDSDYERAKKIKEGDLLQCEIKKPRNYEFHKKFFALINMVFDNQEHYKDIDALREDLTIEAGYYDKHVNFNGEEIKRAKSISFAAMDELDFQEFYTNVIREIVIYFNFNEEDILENVERYF